MSYFRFDNYPFFFAANTFLFLSLFGKVTKFMYLGLPKASTATAKSFAGAMSEDKEEWVLMACLDDIETGCDFSSADPSA